MKVKAAEGLRVPMENRAHAYIEGAAVEVPDSPYYRRLLTEGDLIRVAGLAEPVASVNKKGAKNE